MAFIHARHRSIIAAAVFTTVALVALGAAVWFTLEQNAKYRDVRAQLSEISAQAQRVNALQTRWNSVSEKATNISRAFVRRDALADFLEAVEATAENDNVIETTSIVDDTQTEITLRLRVTGRFENIFSFSAHLNVLPNLLFVERVAMTSGSTSALLGVPGQQRVVTEATADIVVRVPLQVSGAGAMKPKP